MRPGRLIVRDSRVVATEPGTPFESLDGLAAAVRTELEEASVDAAHVVVADRHLQRRTLVDLPPVGRWDLRRLVSEEPHRFFRRRSTPLEVDAAWREGAGEPPLADAVAVERGLVDAVLEGLDAAGVSPLSIAPEKDDGAHLRLEPRELRGRRRGWLARKLGPWVAMAAIPWIVASAVYVADLQRDLSASERTLDSLEVETARLTRIRARIAEVATTANALERATAEGAWASPLLTQLSRVLPDSAHLVSLSLGPAGGRAELLVPREAALDRLLVSRLDVRLEERPTADPRRPGWDRARLRLGGGS